jgi:PRTRC genetic system protein C
MALEVKGLERQFIYDEKMLPDINTSLSAKQVMEVYSNTYPELNNGQIVGPEIKDGKQVFTFKTILGTKG